MTYVENNKAAYFQKLLILPEFKNKQNNKYDDKNKLF